MGEKGVYLVTEIDKVNIYDSITYQEVGTIPVPLLPSESREPN
jgi:hypothetical protein